MGGLLHLIQRCEVVGIPTIDVPNDATVQSSKTTAPTVTIHCRRVKGLNEQVRRAVVKLAAGHCTGQFGTNWFRAY